MKSKLSFLVRRSFRQGVAAAVAALTSVSALGATGDLVTICFNSDGTDDFAIIALANIPGGTRYFISDNAWSANSNDLIQEGGSPSPNGQIQFDVAAGGIPFGTVIRFDQSGSNVALKDSTQGTLTMVARFPVVSPLGKLSFSSVGDQVMIYQTAGNTVGGAVTMVSAFNASVNTASGAFTIVNGWQVGLIPQQNQSAATSECNAPAGLVVYDGTNPGTATAFGLGSFAVGGVTGQDNYRYNGPFGLADKTAYLTAINTPANWSADDTTAFDLTSVGPGPSAPEINVKANALNIPDGSPSPQSADFTIFGSTPVIGGTLTRTFNIDNLGTANLIIPANGITFSGANAGEFSVSGITLPATIPPGSRSNIVVTFDPAAAGVRTAMINIANNDSNENPYNFAIQGNGFNYTPPSGLAPSSKWSSLVRNNNVGATRAVGSTATGDVIAASKINSGNAGNIRVTRHLALTGALSWTRDLDSGNADDVNDMLVDSSNGDTYIAARASVAANLNWFVYKLNGADGTVAWTYSFDGTAAGADNANSIARTSDGNIVVAGDTQSSPSSINFARVVKLNATTGALIWSFLSTTNFSQFNAVATDTSGNTFATGLINEPANGNGLTVKLSNAGAVSWSKAFDGTAGLFDSFGSVAVDANGDCIVGGGTRITSTPTSDIDAIVIKYAAASGNEVWRRLITGASTGTDSINNLAIDATGNIYVAGSIRNVTSTDRDAYIAKITGSTGVRAWITNRLGTGAESSDRFQNVRVSGNAVYAVGNLENANRDIVASRFNATTGAEEWSLMFNGSGNGADDVFFGRSVITLLGTDAFAIGGETVDVSQNIFGFVMKYGPILPPTVSNVNKSAVEDVTASFTAADFTPGSYSDPEGLALTTVRITSLPSNGVLRNGANAIVAVPTDIPIASIGSLNYTASANYNGADSFGWNGFNGTLFAVNGATVNLAVSAVNDKPNFVASNPAAVNEDAGAQSVAGWVSNFSPGPPNESGQTVLAYLVSSVSNPGLFASGPAVASNGTLTYTPAANANGSSTFQVRVQDSGGTSPGVDTSDAQTFTITVNAVNDKPTFAAVNPPTVNEDAGAQSVVGWISSFSPGPANETGQTVLNYTVSSVSNPGLFSAGPVVANNGTLTYTTALNANGSSTFQVRVRDSGGTSPGVDTSDAQIFTITVNPIYDPPIPGTDTVKRVKGRTIKVLKSDLLVNDTSIDGTSPLTIASVSSPSVNGATVRLLGSYVVYESNGSDGDDSFAYIVNDGVGNAQGTVNLVTAARTGATLNIILDATVNGERHFTIAGIPGRAYRLQIASTLDGPWSDVAGPAGQGNAGANGELLLKDVAPLGGTTFYRVIEL